MFATIVSPLEYIYRRLVYYFLVEKVYNNFIIQKLVSQFFIRYMLLLMKQLILYYQLGLVLIFLMTPANWITAQSYLSSPFIVDFQVFSWELKRNIGKQWFKSQSFIGMPTKVGTLMHVKFILNITYLTDVSLIISFVVFVKRRLVFVPFYQHSLHSFHSD